MVKALKIYGIPVILGLFVFLFEAHSNSSINSLILIAVTILVLIISRDFTSGTILLFMDCVAIMAILMFVLVFISNSTPNSETVYFVVFNWAAINSVCILFQFLQKKGGMKNFQRFFKVSSILFGIIYVASFVYMVFLKNILNYPIYYRSINLVPFVHTIIPYITGAAITNESTMVENLTANLLLYLPIGFYLTVCSNRIPRRFRALCLIILPILVEALQYVFAVGISDIDDVILNIPGGFLGVLLCLGMEKAYRAYQHNNKAKLFAI